MTSNSQAITFDVIPKTTVSGSRIYLSDLVKCSGSSDLCREISGIEVAASPAPGRSSLILKSTLESILEKEWPGVSFELIGAESIRAESLAVDIPLDELKMKLQNAINLRTSNMSGDLRILIMKIQPIGSLAIRPTQSQIDFIDLDAISFENPDILAKHLPGNRTLAFRATNPNESSDKLILQISASFVIERLLPTLVSSLLPGQTITDSNVVMTWIPIRRGVQDFAVSKDSLVGRKSRQALNAGEMISVRSLESPVAVGRNQIVNMIVRKGDLEISARATTVDQGAVGQTVQVVNMANKLRMRAKVIDEKTVEAIAF